jgi:hypothetical protein
MNEDAHGPDFMARPGAIDRPEIARLWLHLRVAGARRLRGGDHLLAFTRPVNG